MFYIFLLIVSLVVSNGATNYQERLVSEMEMTCQMSRSTLDNHGIRSLTHISCNQQAYRTCIG